MACQEDTTLSGRLEVYCNDFSFHRNCRHTFHMFNNITCKHKMYMFCIVHESFYKSTYMKVCDHIEKALYVHEILFLFFLLTAVF